MLPVLSIGSFDLYIYPLLLGISWAVSYKLAVRLILELELEIPKAKPLLFTLFILSWLGAKLLFLATLDTSLINRAISSSSFWTGGGFVFYGGAIAGSLTVLIFARVHKIKLSTFSFLIPPLIFGHSIGRLGCFFAGCCYGKVCDLPGLGIFMHGAYRYPTSLIESFGLGVLGFIFLKRVRLGRAVILEYFISYGLFRFLLEFWRGDLIRGVSEQGLSTSQYISIAIVIISIVLIRVKKIN